MNMLCIKNGWDRLGLSLKRSAAWRTSEGTFVAGAGTDSFVDRTVFVDGPQKRGNHEPRLFYFFSNSKKISDAGFHGTVVAIGSCGWRIPFEAKDLVERRLERGRSVVLIGIRFHRCVRLERQSGRWQSFCSFIVSVFRYHQLRDYSSGRCWGARCPSSLRCY